MNDLIVKEKDQFVIDPQIASIIVEYSTTIKVAEKKLDEIKTLLKEAMVKNKIIKVEGDGVKVTYIGPTDTETFDKKSFRRDYPDTYDKYVSFKKRDGYIKVEMG